MFGANIRYIICQKLQKIYLNEYVGILLINTFSSFFLGLLIPIMSKKLLLNFSSQLVAFFLIGFLGSLSTFSAFVYDLFDSYLKFNFFRVLNLFALSVSLGISALALGSLLVK